MDEGKYLKDLEESARKLFGYDDASLNAEMNEAERAWAAEKATNPKVAARLNMMQMWDLTD